jgi:hypothetical protein
MATQRLNRSSHAGKHARVLPVARLDTSAALRSSRLRLRSPSGDPNKTVFKQEENFTGMLGFLSAFGKGPSEGWNKVNRDLKVEAERVWRERQ